MDNNYTIELNGEFHRTYEIKELDKPGIPDFQTIHVRIQLISGEFSELAAALAAQDPVAVFDALVDSQYVVDGTFRTFGIAHEKRALNFAEEAFTHKKCLGMTDLGNNLSLLAGLNRELGRFILQVQLKQLEFLPSSLNRLQLELDYAWFTLGFARLRNVGYAEVHRSNMSKLGADGKPIKFPSGKVGKGPNFSEPNLVRFMTTRPEELPDADWTLWKKAVLMTGYGAAKMPI